MTAAAATAAAHPAAWTGMVPVDDTALAVTDTGGPGRPVVYLNGSYADQSHWRRVITELGGDYRHITYDERARGKSKLSQDYSFEACLRDLDAVLTARGVGSPSGRGHPGRSNTALSRHHERRGHAGPRRPASSSAVRRGEDTALAQRAPSGCSPVSAAPVTRGRAHGGRDRSAWVSTFRPSGPP
ncbi:hypothetical protein AB0F25_38545 [Streptomyces wedmorensis]|uniref:alpha/beta fold hydrolase n=1 Tax=Streptomyces wedmorensis TaxID=43759 RepID=UPI00341751AC